MNHFVNKTIERLANRQGETLVEVLVSILIGGLAVLLMATAIAAASRTVMATRAAFGTYYDNSTSIVNLDSATSGTVTLTTEAGVAVAVSDQSDKSGISIQYSQVTTSGTPIVAYSESTE